MSDQGPTDPANGRPRLAEALASLKEGLRDTADPFYDSWKVKRRPPRAPASSEMAASPAVAASSEAASSEIATALPATSEMLLGGPTIEQTRPPEWHLTEVMAPLTEAQRGDRDGASPREEVAALALPTEDVAALALPTEDVAVPNDDAAWPGEDVAFPDESAAASASVDLSRAYDPPRVSVPADTVSVRVVPYRVFPRWAMVVVATLVVFSVCVFALRASLPETGPSEAGVVAAEVARPPAPIHQEFANSPGPVASPRPVDKAAPTDPNAPQTDPDAPQQESEKEPLPSAETTGAVPSAVPAGRLMTPPPRRRASAHDFFRDPGF